jgi:chitin synthase
MQYDLYGVPLPAPRTTPSPPNPVRTYPSTTQPSVYNTPSPVQHTYTNPAASVPSSLYSPASNNLSPPDPFTTSLPGGLDETDIPLLQRDSSTGSRSSLGRQQMPQPTFPGAFDNDELESNIRYGRIPQRVQRRYKTVKKIE